MVDNLNQRKHKILKAETSIHLNLKIDISTTIQVLCQLEQTNHSQPLIISKTQDINNQMAQVKLW